MSPVDASAYLLLLGLPVWLVAYLRRRKRTMTSQGLPTAMPAEEGALVPEAPSNLLGPTDPPTENTDPKVRAPERTPERLPEHLPERPPIPAWASPLSKPQVDRPSPEKLVRVVECVYASRAEAYQRVTVAPNGAGIFFGISSCSQASGSLGVLLSQVEAKDPMIGVAAFGPGWPALLRQMTAPSKDIRLAPCAGSPVWEEPWLAGWARLGAHPEVQKLQQAEASRGEGMQHTLLAARTLQTTSLRALVILFEFIVTQGWEDVRIAVGGLASEYAGGKRPRLPSESEVLTQVSLRMAQRYYREGHPPTQPMGAPWYWKTVACPSRSGVDVYHAFLGIGPLEVDLWEAAQEQAHAYLSAPDLDG